IDSDAVAPMNAFHDRFAFVDGGYRGAQRPPYVALVIKRLAPGGDCLDVRTLVKRLGIELPHPLERRIVQPHAPVAAEYRHCFGKVVERFALHLDERFEAAAE